MNRRRTSELTPEQQRRKWREFWSKMLMASILFACVPWGVYVYERTTGLTYATERNPGRLATPERVSWVFDRAVGMTIFALPCIVFTAIKRHEYRG